MRKTMRIWLPTILTTVFLSLAISSTATGQTTDTAATFPKSVSSCEDRLAVALQRLDKTLDAYEKAVAVIGAKDAVIAAKDNLIGAQKELLTVKDQYIADVLADNKFLRGKSDGAKSKTRKLLEKVEKTLLFIGGIYIGRGL